MQNARKIAGWVAGIASCLLLSIGAEELLRILHIPTYLPIPFLDSEGELHDGFTTDVGIVVHILSIMLAIRIGEAVYTGRITARYDRADNVDFLVWLACIFTYGMGSTVLFFIFKDFHSDGAAVTQMCISIAMIVGLYLFGKRCRERLTHQPSQQGILSTISNERFANLVHQASLEMVQETQQQLSRRLNKISQQSQTAQTLSSVKNHQDTPNPLEWNPAKGKEDYDGLGQMADYLRQALQKRQVEREAAKLPQNKPKTGE